MTAASTSSAAVDQLAGEGPAEEQRRLADPELERPAGGRVQVPHQVAVALLGEARVVARPQLGDHPSPTLPQRLDAQPEVRFLRR